MAIKKDCWTSFWLGLMARMFSARNGLFDESKRPWLSESQRQRWIIIYRRRQLSLAAIKPIIGMGYSKKTVLTDAAKIEIAGPARIGREPLTRS